MSNKSNKSSKEEEPQTGNLEQQTESANAANNKQSLQEMLKTIALLEKRSSEAAGKHDFWDTQPVPKMDEVVDTSEHSAIEPPKSIEEIRKTPYNLPTGFEWSETDMDDEKTMKEVYDLLNQNYVEDDDNMFRFDYSMPFLKWAVKPPGYLKQWHIGVRVSKNQKLVGFITAIPADIQVYEEKIKMVEINFLCVHKKLREKRLAPVLIKEITRRVNLTGIFQAVYTAGRVIPKPVGRCRYWHRSLNPKKLIDVGFSHLGPRMTMNRTIKLYRLPEEPQCPGISPMEPSDVPSVTKLLNKYLENFNLKALFTETEVAHWFIPQDGVIYCYVIRDAKTKEATDFVSFYCLPSSIIGNTKYKILKAAYSFYNVATTVPLTKLVNDALILAKKQDFDVFNCLDLMENETFLKDLKFGKGDGNLQYYLFNWRCPEMPQNKIGLVLL